MRGMVVELVVVEEHCVVGMIELEQVFQVASSLVRVGLNVVYLD